MGTFSKGVQELNVTGYHTITDSGTPGTVTDDLYENSSENDFVLFHLQALCVSGGSISVAVLNMILKQKNYETGTYFDYFTTDYGLTGSKSAGLHRPAMSLANIRIMERLGRFNGSSFELNAYDAVAGPGAVFYTPPPIILWPNEKVTVQTNIPSASGDINIQWAAHIIRNPG